MSKLSNPLNPQVNFTLSCNFATTTKFLNFHPLSFTPELSTKISFTIQSSHSPPRPSEKTPQLISVLRRIPDWADRLKEDGMAKKRVLYDHEKWVEHRSSFRHVRHLMSSLSSRVILSLIPPVIFFTSVAVIVASYNSAVDLKWLPEFFPVLRASSLPYQLTAPALALLLVFRTEASYSRFEQGRKAWTKVIAGTNDFAGQVIANVNGSSNVAIKKALLQYIMAFPVALKKMMVPFLSRASFPDALSFCELFLQCHLINGSDAKRDLQDYLEAGDLAVVLNSKHRPHCIIQFISQSLHMINLEESKRNILESKISCFHEGIGVCDQIEGIPIPLSYTRLTSRFLVLWHLTLPIILWDDCHWMVVPSTFISAASLFCIEEVGVLIEEPFPMLALDELCKVVRSNILEVLATEELVQAQVRAKRKNQYAEQSSNGWPGS